jgi:hypothetical protein
MPRLDLVLEPSSSDKYAAQLCRTVYSLALGVTLPKRTIPDAVRFVWNEAVRVMPDHTSDTTVGDVCKQFLRARWEHVNGRR